MRTRILISLGCVLSVILSFFSFSQAAVIRVPADHSTIRSGVDSAEDGDVVLVADGVYFQEHVQFNRKKIKVVSENGPDKCIMDGAGSQGPAVGFISQENRSSVFSGFTIRNYYNGIGVWTIGACPIISDCRLINNRTAILNQMDDPPPGTSPRSYYPAFVRCTIRNNTYGIYSEGSAINLINCLVYNNSYGLNSRCYSSNALSKIINCTITGNDYGIHSVGTARFHVLNSIVYGNTHDIFSPKNFNGVISHSIFKTISTANGGETITFDSNINSSPRFVNPRKGRFRLLADSPAIDSGDNTPIERFRKMLHTGADLARNKRIVNGTVDIGAYEFR